MLFNSYFFIFVFLPISLIGYFALNKFQNKKIASVFLTGMSLWFYAYFNPSYIFIITGSILVNFCIYSIMRKNNEVKRLALIVGIVFNVLLIFAFKYLDFFSSNINAILKTDIPMLNILMPLGISFFTFQQIGFLVDAYRDEIEHISFIEYSLFVSFFPQLIAGPIVSIGDMLPQFRDEKNKKINYENFADGLIYFIVGLAKKVLIADTLGVGVDFGFDHYGNLVGPEVVVSGILYTIQLYFDFSGYCDMACGIGKMFNINLPINFDSPYKALSVREFWKRWHISLTRFLTKYIYIPLGGNRKGTIRKYINIIVVFVVSGIWHGANWTYILWGCLHGVGSVLYQVFEKIWKKFPKIFRWIVNFLFVSFGFTLFRAPSVKSFAVMLSNIGVGWDHGLTKMYLSQFDILELTYLESHIYGLQKLVDRFPWINLSVVLLASFLIVVFGKNIYEQKRRKTVASSICLAVLAIWSICSLSNMATFLYFNF